MKVYRAKIPAIPFILLSALLFFHCSGNKQHKYVNQLKENLSVYDSITTYLINNYSTQPGVNSNQGIHIYPSPKMFTAGNGRLYDSFILDFCTENNINAIQMGLADIHNGSVKITYFISDNNHQYIFNNKGIPRNDFLENNRVLVIPVTKNWQYQYEKPNF